MIEHSIETSVLRFYEADEPDHYAPIDVVCMLMWETQQVVWIKILKGDLSRKLLRQLVDKLGSLGITTVKAQRAPHRGLPFGSDVGGHWEMSVAVAHRYLNRRAYMVSQH